MDETENVSSRVNSFLQAHLFNTKLFGNDSVLIDLLYEYQLGQNSRFCPVPMPVKKKGRQKVPFLHQFPKKNMTDFEGFDSKLCPQHAAEESMDFHLWLFFCLQR